jgi:predicted AAA+ superfamily ATPase
LKRALYGELLLWKSSKQRKPLLLQGARQTGKTYLLQEFGRLEYDDLAYFNFEETPEIGSLFDSSLRADTLIESLSAAIGRRIRPGTTLVFLDEIQSSPRALTSLKYFREQAPEYHVAAAGSLLGVSVGKTSSFPVGKVSFMTLFPMTFFEYLEADGEALLLEQLQLKEASSPLPEAFHEKLFRLFKYYLFLGGMPEVVEHYLEQRCVETARRLQKEILAAYERDFSKYTSASEAMRVSEIWRSIPAQLARENKKFKYSDVRKGGRASRFESAIEWLRQTGLVYLVHNVKVPKLPLAGYADTSKFKMYILDTGLLGAMLDLPSKTIVAGDRLFSEYYGAFIENYVAAELIRRGFGDLYYWTSKSEAEVDFVLGHEGAILPLEVKSGTSRRTKSLRVYAGKYTPPRVFRASSRNFTLDGDLTNIPLYAVGRFPDKL